MDHIRETIKKEIVDGTGALVSVVLPVHNEARWLSNCIKSFENQTYTNLEIIVIDDGSKDNSYEVAQGLSKTSKLPITVYRFPKNSGEGTARTKGIELAKGTYIIQTDADALFPPDFVENSFWYTRTYNTTGVSIGRIDIIPELKGPVADYARAKRWASFTIRSKGEKAEVIGMYFFPKKMAEDLNYYAKNAPLAIDLDFALRAKEKGFTTVWAKDVFFYHADPWTWKIFFHRLYNAARYNAPMYKRWGKWLTPTGVAKEIIQNAVVVVLILAGFIGFWKPYFFFAWLIYFLMEGIAPIILHKETREILRVGIQKKYWLMVLCLPLITIVRLRANSFGKLYAILFPKKVERAVTFDV